MRNDIDGAILILGSPNIKSGIVIGLCEHALIEDNKFALKKIKKYGIENYYNN